PPPACRQLKRSLDERDSGPDTNRHSRSGGTVPKRGTATCHSGIQPVISTEGRNLWPRDANRKQLQEGSRQDGRASSLRRFLPSVEMTGFGRTTGGKVCLEPCRRAGLHRAGAPAIR